MTAIIRSIIWVVLVAVFMFIILRQRRQLDSCRARAEGAEDRFEYLSTVYNTLEKAHEALARQAPKDIWLAEQKGFNDAKAQIFRESGELRHGFGPLLSIDSFMLSNRPGVPAFPKGTDDPKLEKFIERARNDFLIEQYREGYGIRSEVKTTMVRFEDSFSTGPRARFMFMAMGTPLVAPPEDSNQEVSWLIHRARIDTDSVDVRPHKE